jgi:hypothetical protein
LAFRRGLAVLAVATGLLLCRLGRARMDKLAGRHRPVVQFSGEDEQ